jgi:hypothetical protein
MHLGNARWVFAALGKLPGAFHEAWLVALALALILPSTSAQSMLWPSIAPETTLRPGVARIWIYRDYEPSDGAARVDVRVDGWVIGVPERGDSFFRDVRPGAYNVTVDPVGHNVSQFATVALTAGQTVFIKVESWKRRESDPNFSIDTFRTRLIPPEIAALELVRSRFIGGG